MAENYREGILPERSAVMLLKTYNKKSNTNLTMAEINSLDDTFVFSPAGDWIIFTDDLKSILRGAEENGGSHHYGGCAHGDA